MHSVAMYSSQRGVQHSCQGKCIDLTVAFIISSVFNAATDIIMLILPLPLIWKLKLSTARRLQLMGIFLIGGLYGRPPNAAHLS